MSRAARFVVLCALALATIAVARSICAQDVARHEHTTDRAAQQWLQQLGTVQGTWQAVQRLHWSGQALWLRQFSSNQSLDAAAQQITKATTALDRVLTGPDTLLLAGSMGNLHLVVQLQQLSGNLQGFASALDVSASARTAQHPLPDSVLVWFSQDTQIHASQWRLADGGTVRQFVHVVPQAPDQLRARLHPVLAQQGWRMHAPVTGAHDGQWHRGADRLLLLPGRHGHGSVLYLVLITGESP